MKFFLTLLFLPWLITLSLKGQTSDSAGVPENAPAYDFAELKVGKDLVLKNCRITRREADALIVSHSGGIARVSLFDVSEEIQKEYDFDPITAMAKYREDQERLLRMKKERFLEAEKFKALEAARLDKDRQYEEAAKQWIPAMGTIVEKGRQGCFVRASKIMMVPTKTKSALGFETDGPPKKKLVPLGHQGLVFLTGIDAPMGNSWKGYINPMVEKKISIDVLSPPLVPVHEALDLKE